MAFATFSARYSSSPLRRNRQFSSGRLQFSLPLRYSTDDSRNKRGSGLAATSPFLSKKATLIVVVMGVTGAGKTTVGSLLAQQLGWEFMDADNFHPESNLAKMRRGIPLSDDDRRPWLELLRAEIARRDEAQLSLVLACSALKEEYRRILVAGPSVKFVYLNGDAQQIAQRLRARRGHFADEQILAGQFADLEEPDDAIRVDVGGTPEKIVMEIREKLGI